MAVGPALAESQMILLLGQIQISIDVLDFDG
jgi:hypothetical protein